MARTAKGTFEVKLSPEPPYDESDGVSLGRVALDKIFVGELTATSTGQMIGARSREVKGSAGYVAIERVVGSLEGREGSFVLQHFGVMTRGTGELKVSVVPDTGTGGLSGIAGRMNIEIVDGKHYYTFEYSFDALPPAPLT
jgi:hypothetical protein